MATRLTNFAGSISALSEIQPLDVKDNTLLNLLLRERVVGNEFVNVRPGAFATPTAPATPVTPTAPAAGATVAPAAIDLLHVSPGDLITASYINSLIDALLALDKRLAKVEARGATATPPPVTATPTPPPPPIVATPVPPGVLVPNFTFALANELANVEIDASEIDDADEIRIGDIAIPRTALTIEGGRARFTAPADLFRAGAGNTPDLTLVASGGPRRVFTGITRPVQ